MIDRPIAVGANNANEPIRIKTMAQGLVHRALTNAYVNLDWCRLCFTPVEKSQSVGKAFQGHCEEISPKPIFNPEIVLFRADEHF